MIKSLFNNKKGISSILVVIMVIAIIGSIAIIGVDLTRYVMAYKYTQNALNLSAVNAINHNIEDESRRDRVSILDAEETKLLFIENLGIHMVATFDAEIGEYSFTGSTMFVSNIVFPDYGSGINSNPRVISGGQNESPRISAKISVEIDSWIARLWGFSEQELVTAPSNVINARIDR